MPRVLKAKQRTSTADDEREDAMLVEVADVQTEVDEINLKTTNEILQVEAKYNQLRKPHYEKRGELIKKVANFWKITLMNHPKVGRALDPDAKDCLLSLSHLVVVEADDIKSGYRITFYFDENPYFENKELVKEYFFSTLSKSTTIDWKEGKSLHKEAPTKKYTRKRFFHYKSFFDWFSHDADIVDDEIGMSIRDEIWSNPLEYYQLKDLFANLEQAEQDEANKTS